MNMHAPLRKVVVTSTLLGSMVLGSLAPFLTTSAQASTGCPYMFTRNLSQGASGMDVMKLQQLLNSDLLTRVAASGVGSSGNETQYFGPATRNAVVKFQEKYKSEVLTPFGLIYGTGFVGASTRAKLNSLCSASPAQPSPTKPSTPTNRGPEASIEKYKVLNSPSGEDLEEGETRKVMASQFNVDDSDVTLSRVDVHFKAIGTVRERRPWNMLDEVTLYANAKKLATVTADKENQWRKESNDTYSIRFSGLKEVLKKNRAHELSIEASVQRRLDSADVPQDFQVWFPEDGIRMRDQAGLDQYAGSDTESTVFTAERAGLNQELKVRASNSDPDATVLPVKTSTKSSEYTIAVFELEAKDGNAAIETVPVTLYSFHDNGSPVAFNRVVDSIRLEIDGQKFDDYTVGASTVETVDGLTTTATVLTFEIDRGDLSLASGDREAVKVVAAFRKADGNYGEGQKVKAAMTSANVDAIEAEGVRTLGADKLTGSAQGEIHMLRSEGVILTPLSANAGRLTSSTGPNQGQYTAKIRVTAFKGDFYIPLATARVDASGTVISGESSGGIYYAIERDNGEITNGTAFASLDSTARRQDNAYVVRDGQTEEFTLRVTFTPDTTAYHAMRVEGIRFRSVGESDSSAVLMEAIPEHSYRTEVEFLSAE